MKKQMTICEPRISDALLTNPGIGFIAAPELMKTTGDQVRDNRGNPVAPYRFTPTAKPGTIPIPVFTTAAAVPMRQVRPF